MSESATVHDSPLNRIADYLRRLSIRHIDLLTRSPLYAPAVNALIETETVLACQRRMGQRLLRTVSGKSSTHERRIAREQADRVVLDPQRASMAHPPKVWWHEGGSGPTLVLLNGWTASGLMWPGGFVNRLEESHRVIRIDNRGTGYSRTAPAPFTIRNMADDVADVLRVVGGPPVAVVGLSMGGMLAQELAIRHPALVRQLVLVGTRPPAPAHIPAATAVLERVLATPRPEETLKHFVASLWTSFAAPGFATKHPDLVAELVEQVLRRVTPTALVNAQMRAIAAWHGAARLRTLRCPTVVVHGAVDRLMPVGNGMRLAQLIPEARYQELPNVGHIVPLEASHELESIIRGGH